MRMLSCWRGAKAYFSFVVPGDPSNERAMSNAASPNIKVRVHKICSASGTALEGFYFLFGRP